MAFIHGLSLVEPPYKHRQDAILSFMLKHFAASSKESRMLAGAFAGSGIQTRNSILPDFSDGLGAPQLFKADQLPSISTRMELYKAWAARLIADAVENTIQTARVLPQSITHLITFSCTGLSNPGIENTIFKACRLLPGIETHFINFAGCHGAFKAIKLAKSLAKSYEGNAHILVCGIELCTLHFMPGTTGDQIRANTIFSDGCAAFMVSSEAPTGQDSYAIDSHQQATVTAAEDVMSWNIGESAFYMTLSSKIEQALKSFNIPQFIGRLHEGRVAKVVCHPGGKSILDCVRQQLGDNTLATLESSYKVLQDFGNMSSISILQVLEEEFRLRTKHLSAIGFGPGLTVEGLALRLQIA